MLSTPVINDKANSSCAKRFKPTAPTTTSNCTDLNSRSIFASKERDGARFRADEIELEAPENQRSKS
jgi:hypothetical protein